LEISKNKVGTYPLQAIIDNLKYEEEKKIVLDSLGQYVTEMSLVKLIFRIIIIGYSSSSCSGENLN